MNDIRATEELFDIYRVVTITEASEIWERPYYTIRMYFFTGRIEGRYSRATILLSVRSLVKVFGQPNRDMVEVMTRER